MKCEDTLLNSSFYIMHQCNAFVQLNIQQKKSGCFPCRRSSTFAFLPKKKKKSRYRKKDNFI